MNKSQLDAQDIRLKKGKPLNVAQKTWNEEKQRYQKERDENTKALEQLKADQESWTKTGSSLLDANIKKAEDALLAAQSTPKVYKDLTVPPSVNGHIPDQTTVGDDPSNVSGAFSSNQGMLHAVQEGFAQANMVSSYDDQQSRAKSPPSGGRFDDERFVTKRHRPWR